LSTTTLDLITCLIVSGPLHFLYELCILIVFTVGKAIDRKSMPRNWVDREIFIRQFRSIDSGTLRKRGGMPEKLLIGLF